VQQGEDGEGGPSTLPAHTKLARSARFQAFVLRSTLKGLQNSKRQADVIPGAACSRFFVRSTGFPETLALSPNILYV
jgi:hypothetical protein